MTPVKLVLDVVITNASKAPYNKIKKKGEEAEAAAKGKCDKLAYKCIQHGYKFSPISFETQGQWSKDTKCLFKSIISQISSNTHARTQSATYWIRKISITLQTFVSYHIRKSIHSVNPLFQDAHTKSYLSIFICQCN